MLRRFSSATALAVGLSLLPGCFSSQDPSSTAQDAERGQAGTFYLLSVSGPPLGGIVSSGTDGRISCGASTLGETRVDANGVLQHDPAWYPGAGRCGPAQVLWDETVVLAATPVGEGLVFIGWAGDCSGIGTCTLSAGADRTVVAIFGKPGSGHPNLMDPGEHGPAYDSQSYGGNPLVCTSCHGPALGGQGIAPACATCHDWPRPVEVTYTIGGTVSGLAAAGLVLGTPGQPDLPVAPGATSFTFSSPVFDGTGYDVRVVQQPAVPAQICTVAEGSGSVAGASVTGISVSCADSFTIGGVISGLAGSGLTLASPGQPDLVVPAGATGFVFATPVLGGAAYSVTVARHPQGPAQTCAVTSGSGAVGTADVGTVSVSCRGDWSRLAVGGGHTVGIRPDGTLWGWGYNEYGQVGTGAAGGSVLVPVQVGTDTDWSDVVAGDSHTVALKTDGSLWAWGLNDSGQIGDGTIGAGSARPVQVGTLTGWTSMSAGARHTLAIRSDGTLWSWGDATYGQLGRGASAVPDSQPRQVGSGSTWTSVAAGAFHSLAVQSNGSLWGWGFNSHGQVGEGSSGTNVGSPVQVGAGTAWTNAAGGILHSVGVRTDGSLWTWGGNSEGQLGNGTIGGLLVTTPTLVGSGTGWKQVAAGIYHSIATGTDGSLWAWGTNFQGQVTGSPSGVAVNAPTRLGTGTGWIRALAGGYDSLVLADDGSIWAWGSNAFGQMGDGTTVGAGLAP